MLFIEDLKSGKKGFVLGEVEEKGQDFIILSDTTGKIIVYLSEDIEKIKKGDKIILYVQKEGEKYHGSYPKKVNINFYHYEKYVKLLRKFKEYLDTL